MGAPEALTTGWVLLVMFVGGRVVVAEPGCVGTKEREEEQ